MTILLDTNIILDALEERFPFDEDAKRILLLGQSGEIDCRFTANAASDIFYLYSKNAGKRTAKIALDALVNIYDVISVDKADCRNALALPNEDFEDALMEVCAKKSGANFIISRDDEFISAATEVKVIKPDEFISRLTR